ncbi:DUF2784 domain-containing protein [Nocardioides sp. JQ2195]|uniref:DUF2784 domain-containing protein n=1 Tax=Nocardioides sp. JQ2195 TaxID=2592334 RepID=UPI00143EA5C2|nr:DUF2784 domain-containing protein [Nocardioides sp. JQ2195]QIX27319.1 DUF2784 domain-containing protein [Nocardioides sp. JQ2195]
MQTDSGPAPGGLEVRRRRWTAWLWVPALCVLVAVGLWWTGRPSPLPTSDRSIEVTVKTGQQVYVGVSVDVDRDIEISGVEMETTSSTGDPLTTEGLDLRTWICRDGAISQTTEPERFCADVLPAEGSSLHLGGADQLMLSVDSSTPVDLHLDRLRIEYREGLQRATQDFGPTFDIAVLGEPG